MIQFNAKDIQQERGRTKDTTTPPHESRFVLRGHQPGTTDLNPTQEEVTCSRLVEKKLPSCGDACRAVSSLKLGDCKGFKTL